ncbi:MAG: alpha/beta fold hydrolase [Alphaproteobacteria bacterium]|nr:alpha/beta fold hydrolase [Alphaproteobacteria bacterium]
MRATIRGHALRYEVEGSGPPVLLVMGFGMSGEAWLPLVRRLRDRFTLCRYDARGLGDSTPGDGPHHLRGLADDAAALLDHLGWDRAHVTGVSMGGMISQHLALRHRPRVRTLGLLATHGGPGWRCLPERRAIELFVKANTRAGVDRMEVLRHLLLTDPEHPPAEFDVEQLRSVSRPAPRRVRLRHLASILRHDTLDRLRGLHDLPALVLRPDHDVLVPPRCSDALADALPLGRLHPIPDGGHGALVERADGIAEALAAFWQEHEA